MQKYKYAACMWPQNILCCYNVFIVNCDNKRSNQRLMNIFSRKRAISADFCKISKINDRREKPYDFLNNISLIRFSINMKFPLLQKISKLFTFLSFLNQLSCITSYKMSVYLLKWPLTARIAWKAYKRNIVEKLFAEFFICAQIQSKEIRPDELVSDPRYFVKLEEVLLFPRGILAMKCD